MMEFTASQTINGVSVELRVRASSQDLHTLLLGRASDSAVCIAEDLPEWIRLAVQQALCLAARRFEQSLLESYGTLVSEVAKEYCKPASEARP